MRLDVWALGCLLYKLCYYTTPFEEHGPLAIVNAKYTFPPMPQYSPQLQHLIGNVLTSFSFLEQTLTSIKASMLVEHPARRPTVFEVLRVAHEMSGTRPEVDYVSTFAHSPHQPHLTYRSLCHQSLYPFPSNLVPPNPSRILPITSWILQVLHRP